MRRLLLQAAALGLVMCAPGGAWADNQETAQQIASNLRTSGKMKGYSVGVKVEDGTAWLNGTVANQEQMVDRPVDRPAERRHRSRGEQPHHRLAESRRKIVQRLASAEGVTAATGDADGQGAGERT